MFAPEFSVFHAHWAPRLGRVLLRWSLGTRLLGLMALAAATAIALTVSGLRGMADTAAGLQRIHDERMVPVRTLSDISRLMLANQYQLQIALARLPAGHERSTADPRQLDPAAAQAAATAIQRDADQITKLWGSYIDGNAAPMTSHEHTLAERFAHQRDRYLREGIAAALEALREGDAIQVSNSARHARRLYQQADEHLQALVTLQFEQARGTYEQGMAQYRHTRAIALWTLPLAIVLLGLLGWWQIRAITLPLRRVRVVFERIARGKLDSTIAVPGRDEISSLLRDLGTLQARLADNEREMDHLVHYDQLTSLPNRRLLRERITRALGTHVAQPGHRALLLLDLDHFKAINDTLGHEEGDRYLQETARRLSAVAHPRHVAARIGGDEFVVLSGPLGPDEAAALIQAEALAQELLERLAHPWQALGQQHHGSASIGIALFKPGQALVAELLKRADLAMYEAKNGGRGSWCVFDPKMQTTLEERATLTAALHDAIEREQLHLHLQPQVDARGHVIGAEALLRWHTPTHGWVSPEVFIPLAEASGAIVPIGTWVIRQACAELARWQAASTTRVLKLSVNVSPRQFKQADFVAQVLHLINASGIDATQLVIELTESLVIDDIADTIAKMDALAARGVCFALDDFGTGYSSLSLLRQLPLHLLKIDRSFVRDVAHDQGSATVAQAIVGLAQGLGLKTIAEGVETRAQHAALHALGCSFFQGYLFARPMPQAQFAAWLAQSEPAFTPLEDTPS